MSSRYLAVFGGPPFLQWTGRSGAIKPEGVPAPRCSLRHLPLMFVWDNGVGGGRIVNLLGQASVEKLIQIGGRKPWTRTFAKPTCSRSMSF
jgi:hypothetical protein